jgi:proteasome lid subunit RPN8/RPN11
VTDGGVLLPEGVRVEMLAHAREDYPNECCGFLIGDGMSIDECVRVSNVDPRPAVRYAIDPAEHIAVVRRLRGTSQSIVGCYHSHPSGPPAPSPSDVAEAYYPEFVWVIVSAHGSHAGEIGAFRVRDGAFRRLRIEP